MNFKKIISISAGLALIAGMTLAIPAFAQTNSTIPPKGQGRMGDPNGMNRGSGMMRPGIFGTVTAINGSDISVNGRQGFGSTTSTVAYLVNAANATVKKNNATSTISSIAVGDMVAVQGTVVGTSVTATAIFDGIMGRMGGKGGTWTAGQNGQEHATSTPVLGNGQPVIAGSIASVNGNVLNVTTASNLDYTVDASSAKILQGQNTVALSNLTVGNKVLVQGTVNGTSVAASTIIDQSAPPSGTGMPAKAQSRGFFGSIGQFFMHIFGF